MKKIIIALLYSTLAFSCAHHPKDAHHHHKCDKNCSAKKEKSIDSFNHKCAASVLEGDTHIEGKEEYKITHAGKVYYFSSLDKKNKFESNLDENVEMATKQWSNYDHDHDHGSKNK